MAKLYPTMLGIVILLCVVLVIAAKSDLPDTGAGLKLNTLVHKSPNRIPSILKSLPAPGYRDPRGLTWDGSYLWMAEDDTKSLYMIDTLDGTVMDTIPTPGLYNTQGLAWDGSYLWHAEYDGLVYKIDPRSKTYIDTITAPTDKPTGLTWDGINLWAASYIDDWIYKFSPVDGALMHSFAAPAGDPWGLAWSDTSLWNAQLNGYIYELDPVSGATKNIYPPMFDIRILGMTTDGQNLWIVDGDRDSLHKIDILAIATDIDYQPIRSFPVDFHLSQNFPNPFNPSTRIKFALPESGTVKLEVYNALGRHIETLLNRQMNAGTHEVEFNAKDLSSGIYYYRISTGEFQAVRKMILLK